MTHWKTAFTFVLLIALCACSRPDQGASPENSSAGQPVAGDWLVVRFEAEPESLNPILHDEQPHTFLFVPMESAAWARRFQDVNWYPARPGYDLRTWYVPTTSRKYTQAK